MSKETDRINRLEDRLMEKLFNEKIINDIIDINHINTMHKKSNNTNTTLIERTINTTEITKNASVFTIDIRDVIETSLMDEVPTIIEWLIKPENNVLNLTVKQEETSIGHGIEYHANTIKEYTTQDITLILIKDDRTDTGFRCITAYPDITSESTTRTPTNRNLIPDLIQTRTFKNAETKTRKQLIQAAINGLDRQLTPIEHIHTDIIRHRAYTDNMQITMDNDNITIHHPNTDGYSTLYISTKETDITNGCTPELNRLKIFVENKFKLQSKRVLTKSEMAKIEEEIYKFPNISENTEKQPGS